MHATGEDQLAWMTLEKRAEYKLPGEDAQGVKDLPLQRITQRQKA